jgi:aminopeptidase N
MIRASVHQQSLHLDGTENLQLRSVSVNGKMVEGQYINRTNTGLTISCPLPTVGESFTVEIETAIKPQVLSE